MPLWAIILSLCFASVPGIAGLLVAIWRMGGMHNEIKNITLRLDPVQRMAEDIAYLKGRQEGHDVERVASLRSVKIKPATG